MKVVTFSSESDLNQAAVIHGRYLEETHQTATPVLSMHLDEGGELDEMKKRFDAQGIHYQVES